MRLLLSISALLVVYGSLYPFDFDLDKFSRDGLIQLLSIDIANSGRGDTLANILLFIPIGFFGALSLPRQNQFLRWVLVLVLSLFLAFVLQVFQLVIPSRTPSGTDVVYNAFGVILGIGASLLVNQALLRLRTSSNLQVSLPLMLAGLWLVWHWSPFVPTLDVQLIKNNLKHIILAGEFEPIWLLQGIITWLVAFYFLMLGSEQLSRFRNLCLLVFLVTFGSVFIAGSGVSASSISGAAIALVIWCLAKSAIGPRVLAASLLGLIIAIAFTPFDLASTTKPFSWIPFSGSLGNNLLVNVLAFFKKGLLYASLIQLLRYSSLRLGTATAVVAVVLTCCEALQIFFENTTPEITDGLLAILLGVAIASFERYGKGLQHPVSALHARSTEHSIPAAASARSIKVDALSAGQVPMTEIPALDGLRALAAISVFFVHFNQHVGLSFNLGPFNLERYLSNGNTGVALFFALSGLLLSIPFWQSKIEGERFPSIRHYALRRLARIIPAYYFCLCAILIYKFNFGGGASINNMLSHLLFLHNVSDKNILSLNQPFWTLAVEIQFYILLPILFLALFKFGLRLSILIIVALIPGLYLLNNYIIESLITLNSWPIERLLIWPFALNLSGSDSWVLRYSTLAHLPHFLIGVLGAYVFLFLNRPFRRQILTDSMAEAAVWLCGIAVFVILATSLDDFLQIQRGRYNFPFVPVLLTIIIVFIPFTRIARSIFELRIIAWLGIISYGIYIYHYPIQKLTMEVLKRFDLPSAVQISVFAATTIVLTLLVSQLSYVLIERPFMRLTRGKQRRPIDSASQVRSVGDELALATRTVGGSLDGGNQLRRDGSTLDIAGVDSTANDHGAVRLSINLRQAETMQLRAICEHFEVDESALFAWLVDNASKPTTDRSRLPGVNGDLPAAAFARPSPSSARDSWTRVNIALSEQQIELLDRIAEATASSRSKTLRTLLAAFTSKLRREGAAKLISRKARNARRRRTLGLVVAAMVITLGIVVALTFQTPSGTSNSPPMIAADWAGRRANLVFSQYRYVSAKAQVPSQKEIVESAMTHGCSAIAFVEAMSTTTTGVDHRPRTRGVLSRDFADTVVLGGFDTPTSGSMQSSFYTVLAPLPVIESLLPSAAELTSVDALQALENNDAEIVLIYNYSTGTGFDSSGPARRSLDWIGSKLKVTSISDVHEIPQTDPVKALEPKLSKSGAATLAISDPGGPWDQAWGLGFKLWGPIASTTVDHEAQNASACAFYRTHLIVPESSHGGVLLALQNGTFWSEHGKLLAQFRLTVDLEGFVGDAYPGTEVRDVDRGSIAVVSVTIKRASDGQDLPLKLELISDCASGKFETVFVDTLVPQKDEAVVHQVLTAAGADRRSCSLRARVVDETIGGPDRHASTNHVRFVFR